MEAAMIPDAGNRTFTIKLENSSQRPSFKYFTTDVVGWTERAMGEGQTRYVPMVWYPLTRSAMPVDEWIEFIVTDYCDHTDAAWSMTYEGLDTMPHHPEVQP
jgi:hypothetical protein